MKIKGYIPDFKLAFEHFCIHTGGRGVIEEIEKQLQLAPDNVQPSKDTLFRYGNTSSSSIWSVFAHTAKCSSGQAILGHQLSPSHAHVRSAADGNMVVTVHIGPEFVR